MWQRLCDLMDASRNAHVLVVGDFMLDRYLYGDAERISPEAPVPVLRIIRQDDALGGAGSVVSDVAALGVNAHCLGMIGHDAAAERIQALLRQAGADVSGLVTLSDRHTTVKTRLIGLAQHRHRQQLIRVDDECSHPVDEATTRELLARLDGLLDRCRAVCVEDYNKGVVSPKVAREVIKTARRRGLPVLVDPASVTDYSRYAGATVVTPNRTETEKVTGLRLRNMDAVREAARQILAACHTEYVCVTLDADGMALVGPGGFFEHVPTRAREVYDVTGAGDEVLAAMAVVMAAGGELREAAMVANIAGGLEVEKFGCVPITRDELIGEILLENHRALGKVRTLDQLLPELVRRRAGHKTVAFTNGCFDLLHAGHVANFAFCKQQADLLVVGLNSDASVRRLKKGADRPLVPQQDRAAVLAALTDVDYVVVFDEETPLRLIQTIGPDVLIKGRDWEGRTVVGQDAVEARGGRVILAPLVPGRSTTELVRRIREVEAAAPAANAP